LALIAEHCGLEPDAVIRSTDDRSSQRRVLKGVVRGQREGLFGVPFFVYGPHRYWGNDRLEWLWQWRIADLEPFAQLNADPRVAETFQRPALPSNHPLREHCLYRLPKARWESHAQTKLGIDTNEF
jgi:hypothetical protein